MDLKLSERMWKFTSIFLMIVISYLLLNLPTTQSSISPQRNEPKKISRKEFVNLVDGTIKMINITVAFFIQQRSQYQATVVGMSAILRGQSKEANLLFLKKEFFQKA